MVFVHVPMLACIDITIHNSNYTRLTQQNTPTMKKVFLLSLLCIAALLVQAAPISMSQARQQAVAFMQQVNPRAMLTTAVAHKAPRKGAAATADEAYYYVFNADNRQGFVIMSGDDRTEAVLGYSPTGHFDANTMPENLRAWLKGYEEQIQWLDDNHISTNTATTAALARRKAQTATRNTIQPMVTSIWDQTAPYNNLCPELTNLASRNAEKTYTGCVATAMAQVMYYNRWPQAATKAVPGYTMTYPYYSTSGSVSYKSMTIDDLPSTTFDWDNMIDDYSGSYTTAQANAVATLMEYCGHSVIMEYGTSVVGGSGTQTNKVAAALVNYFGYDQSSVDYVSRSGYTINQWSDLIYNELKNGRPVVYSGQSDGGGHAFVCDGFSYDDYFHINWGWSGSANGYFLLSVLNPYESGSGGSSTSNGFSYSQGAVIGIQPGCAPAEGGTFSGSTKLGMTGPLTISGTTEQQGVTTAWNIPTGLVNSTNNAVTITGVGFNIYNATTGAYVNRKTRSINKTISSGYLINFTLPVYNTDYTNAGTYILRPFYRVGAQYIEPIGAETSYLVAVVASKTITTLTPMPNPASLVVEAATYNGDAIIGINQNITYTIRNTSATDEYNGKLYLYANSSDNKISTNGVAIPAGKSVDVEMNFTAEDLSAGTYSLILSPDDACNTQLHTRSLTLRTGNFSTSLNKLQVTNANGTRSGSSTYTFTSYGEDFINATVTATNTNANPFKGQITLMLYKNDVLVNQYHKAGVIVPANGTATVQFDITGLDMGYTYRIVPLYYAGSWSDNMTQSTHVLNNGYTYWTADGTRTGVAPANSITVPANAAAIDLSTVNPTTVTPNSNPNTLYYLGEGQTTPTSLNGKNVIKGDNAAAIKLTAGNAFYAPRDFTANSITYTRTFTKGHGNSSDATDLQRRSGWETITLPFAPTSVMESTNELTFFTSDEDETGEYWLYEYGADDLSTNTVYFTYPEQFLANRPYLIAVPGDKWGDKWNLTGKVIVFSANNAQVYAQAKPMTSIGSDYYKFVGNYTTTAQSNIYALNTAGNTFALSSSATVAPFGAYFMIGVPDMAVAPATINFAVRGSNGNTTAIATINVNGNGNANSNWYTLDGRRLNSRPAQKGIYLNNGKKIIIK